MSEPLEGRPVRDTAQAMGEFVAMLHPRVEKLLDRFERLADRMERGEVSMVVRGPLGIKLTATPEVGKP